MQSNEDNTHSPLSDWNWLLAGMHYCYNEERIIGFIYYELLDELYFLDDQNIEAREAHFGFVSCSRDGTIGEPKPIFYAVQRMLGGDPNVKPTYKTEPTTKATTKATDTALTKGTTVKPPVSAPTTQASTESMPQTEPASSDIPTTSGAAVTTGSREDPSSTQEAVGQPSGHPVIWIAVGIAVVVLGGGAAVLAVYLRRRKSGQS